MVLTDFQFLNGLLALITVSLCFIVGLIIVIKYFQYGQKELLYVGITWMAVYQPWWPGSLAFLLNVFGIIDGSIGAGNYILIASMFIPPAIFTWFMGVTEMLFKGKRNIIVGFYLVITILMSTFIVINVLVEPTNLGEIDIVNADYGLIMTLYMMFINGSIAVSGILMGRESLKSEIPQINLKGKFLIGASICYFLGGLLDVGLIESFPWFIFISRTILMSGSVLFYLGFLLPKFLEKLLIKE
jgi:hypothetical protein